jgi:hypothetical protein
MYCLGIILKWFKKNASLRFTLTSPSGWPLYSKKTLSIKVYGIKRIQFAFYPLLLLTIARVQEHLNLGNALTMHAYPG